MKTNLFHHIAIAGTVVGALLGSAVVANAGCSVAIANALGQCWLDDVHKQFGSPLNNWPTVVGLPPNGSGGIAVPPGLQNFGGPIGQPASPPPPPQGMVGYKCATPVGWFWGPPNPVGSQCTAFAPNGAGPFFGQVVQ